MMKERQQDKTNHCPICEDAAKKILELEQRVKVLTDAANCLLKTHAASIFMQGRQIGKGTYVEALKQLQDTVNATPQQTAAQIERWHASRNNKVDMHEDLNNAYSVLIGMSHLLDLKAFNADLLSGRSFLSRMVDASNYPPLPKESKE